MPLQLATVYNTFLCQASFIAKYINILSLVPLKGGGGYPSYTLGDIMRVGYIIHNALPTMRHQICHSSLISCFAFTARIEFQDVGLVKNTDCTCRSSPLEMKPHPSTVIIQWPLTITTDFKQYDFKLHVAGNHSSP